MRDLRIGTATLWSGPLSLGYGISRLSVAGPHQSVGVRIPKSRGHTKVWALVVPTGGKGKVLGRSPNSSVSVIPTCPSQHPFRLAGSQTP